jgi:hypothetical protein
MRQRKVGETSAAVFFLKGKDALLVLWTKYREMVTFVSRPLFARVHHIRCLSLFLRARADGSVFVSLHLVGAGCVFFEMTSRGFVSGF